MCGAFTARLLVLSALLFICGCKRAQQSTIYASPPPAHEQFDALISPMPAPSTPAPNLPGHEIYAAWYDVPAESLAARRAGVDELTAAHNHLPLGTRLRVTHLTSGRSVIVRVTDRGIPSGKAKLDLCRAAAEELGMVSEGIARVRIEILPSETKLAGGASDLQTAAPSH